MLDERKEIVEFKHSFQLPNKDFTSYEYKDLTVKLIKDKKSQEYCSKLNDNNFELIMSKKPQIGFTKTTEAQP